MILSFFLSVFFTLGVSAVCSMLEAMLLSTRAIEVEKLKESHPKAGQLLEALRGDLEGTIASVLTVNTVANTMGSIVVGVLATKAFGDWWLGLISAGMTLAILFFSEILPKNIGVLYRPKLQPILVYPLYWLCRLAGPLTDLSTWLIRKILRRPPEQDSEGEIEMLAEKEAQEGRMNETQLHLIRSTLDLDETTVVEVMTPRNVVALCEAEEKVEDLLERLKHFRFARLPVTGENPDDILGVVRRKDLFHALVTGNRDAKVRTLMQTAVIVPEIGKLQSALELLIARHQQLAVVVDEFGGFAGVLTLEDIFEYLIGREFYEPDDVAVDMQELARRRSKASAKKIELD